MSEPIAWHGDYLALQGLLMRARKAERLTQAQAAAALGMSERQFRRHENGDIPWTAPALFQYAALLGVRVFVPPTRKNRTDMAETNGGAD